MKTVEFDLYANKVHSYNPVSCGHVDAPQSTPVQLGLITDWYKQMSHLSLYKSCPAWVIMDAAMGMICICCAECVQTINFKHMVWNDTTYIFV